MSVTEIHWDFPAAEAILAGPGALAFVEVLAQKGADEARQLSPVDTGYSEQHIRSFGAAVFHGVACAYFGSTSPVWHLIEYGSSTNPPYRTLTHAAERLFGAYVPE